jgi:group I intron endonuclease
MIGIYGLRCKTTGKWNIGQSWDIYNRWYVAYELGHCKSQPKIYRALQKYGYDDFEKRVIEMCDPNIPQEVLDLKETAWIKHFNSIEYGYNITEGGRGSKGRVCTEETRQKIALANTGKKLTVETRKKMSASGKGRKKSEEHKRKISEATIGKSKRPYKRKHKRVMTQEVRNKIRESSKGKVISDWQRMRISVTAKERWAKKKALSLLDKT